VGGELPWREAGVSAAASRSVWYHAYSDRLPIAEHGDRTPHSAAAINRSRDRSVDDAAYGGRASSKSRTRLAEDQIASALPRCARRAVLTAHPTEAKRTVVLEHHRSLYLMLGSVETHVWTPYEQQAISEEVKTLLSLLWRTGEIFVHKRMWPPSGATSCTT